MQIAHKIELKPNNKQKTYFAKACGISRFAYNWALAEWNNSYKENKNLPKEDHIQISGMSLKKKFNALKKDQFPWTKEVTKYAAQQPFLELDRAFKNFFKKRAGFPKFKKKGKSRDSFYVGGDQVKIKDKKIHVPNLGLVRLAEKLRFSGKINSATFSRTADRWFVSIQIEANDDVYKKTLKVAEKDRIVGLDFGIKTMITTSDGHSFENIAPLKKNTRKLTRFQIKLSKKYKSTKKSNKPLKDSKNYQKQKIKVAKLHYKISCQRNDTLHKTTTAIVSNYTSIALEDLNVKGILKNHKLARSISDVGFGKLRTLIESKAIVREVTIVTVDRFYPSSKLCSNCGSIKEDLKLSDRIYLCECGHEMDRDLNASINLKNKIGRVPAESTPVEITALQRSVHPISVTSIKESGSEHQKLCG